MTRHRLIAIMPEIAHAGLPAGSLAITNSGITAVLTADASRRPLLAQTRRSRLEAAVKHQQWLESLLDLGDLLPARQGETMSADEAAEFLRVNAVPLREALAQLSGKRQFQVTVSWMPDGVLKQFRHAPEIAPLFASAGVSPAQMADSVGGLALRLGTTFTSMLAVVAHELISLPRTEAMLTNVALLVAAEAEPALDSVLQEIDAVWSDGLQIRQIGPAAPVSFATLSSRWIAPSEVVAARHLFAGQESSSLAARRSELLRTGHSKVVVDAAFRILRAAQGVAAAGGFHICDFHRDGPGLTMTKNCEAA